MANLDEIEEYNKGTIYPENFDETYIATKYVSEYALKIENDILENLKKKISEKGLFLDDEGMLTSIVIGLMKGNIIFQGPPGTGKTTLAKIVCEVFNVKSDIVTAVSDWSTYDTMGGLQPTANNQGKEIFEGKNGRVVESILNCCNTVLQHEIYEGKEQATWLIVDELNRCEIDKVFGDLFTVFGNDGSVEEKVIPLWFENNKNKKKLHVPNRFRIIGSMNNIDKNYVFDISQGLTRRFTFINVLPPKLKSFDKEIENVKRVVVKKVSKKLVQFGSSLVEEAYLDELLSTEELSVLEKSLKEFLIKVRYDEDNTYLGLNIGTAQIIDVYEEILLNLLLINKPISSDELKRIIDRVVLSSIVPQCDGFDYQRINDFYEHICSNDSFNWLNETKEGIKKLL